tara:strand:- start:2 stop:277 length:276 start_codon:yes stop_codon:yes gene_type:complete
MSIIPEDIKTEEEAMHWLMRHGYSEDLAKEEVAHWTAPPVSIEEIDEDVMDEIEEEEEEEWEDEDEEWEEDEEEWDDEDDSDEDEEDEDES